MSLRMECWTKRCWLSWHIRFSFLLKVFAYLHVSLLQEHAVLKCCELIEHGCKSLIGACLLKTLFYASKLFDCIFTILSALKLM